MTCQATRPPVALALPFCSQFISMQAFLGRLLFAAIFVSSALNKCVVPCPLLALR